MLQRPSQEEYNAYFKRYVDLVDTDKLLPWLDNQRAEVVEFLKSIPEDKWSYSYAPGKWTLKESWVHVLDTERIFAGRALRIARNDMTPIPGFEQDDYVPNSGANERSAASIIREFEVLRSSSLLQLEHTPQAAWANVGTASNSPLSVRAVGYMMGGHVQHHINVTREKYLK